MPKPLGSLTGFKEAFEQDMRLLDGYVNYSAELLRMSLLAITGIATLCVTLHAQLKTSFHDLVWSFSPALCALVIASACALAHRFMATDSMAFHLASLRLHARAFGDAPDPGDAKEAKKQESGRKWRLLASERLLWSSAAALLIGVLFAAHELARW